MKEKDAGTDNSYGPQLGEWAVWDMKGPDHECECPGPPPPLFHLPPPPRPSFIPRSECSENIVSESETCEAVPVIDAEYHYSPALPSLAVIAVLAVTVVVFLFIGTVLVVLKKRKVQHLLPRKTSPHKHCDAATANGVIYEDLSNLQPRPLPSQTTLPSIEMINVTSYPNHGAFGPAFICPSSPVPESFNSQELFNPVYEELSNGSGERGESESERTARNLSSEDEFAEDELSVGGETGNDEGSGMGLENTRLGDSEENDPCRDVDSSDPDDRSKFLKNPRKEMSLFPDCRDKRKRSAREVHSSNSTKRLKNADRRRGWRKDLPRLATPFADCGEFHEGFLLKTVLQFYPDVTEIGSPLPRHPFGAKTSTGSGDCTQSGPHVARVNHRRADPDIFTTFKAIRASSKSRDGDSFSSGSGYNKDCRLPRENDAAVS